METYSPWDDPQLSDGDMPTKKEKIMKFKVGDVLEFRGIPTYAAKKGAKAVCVHRGDPYVYVEWIRNGDDNNQDNGGYDESWFLKIGEISEQEKDCIFKEKKKIMKFDFEKGKEQLLTWMDNEFDCSYGYSLQHIKELSTMSEIQNEIESFRRFEEDWMNKTLDIKKATTMREVFVTLEDTAIEDDDNFIMELFITEQ